MYELFFRNAITFLAYALNTIIFARVILSWLGQREHNILIHFIHETSETILAPIRKLLPRTGMIDLSPLVAFLMIDIIKNLILNSI